MGPAIFSQQRFARSWRMACACLVPFAAVTPAEAQKVASAQMGAQIATSMIVVKTADLDFGKIAYSATPGTVVVSAASAANCSTTGSLLQTGACRAARFEGTVRFLFALQVTEPTGNSINLSGPSGAQMRVDNFTYGAGPGMLDLGQSGANHRFLILNLAGAYSFYMGGTLHVAGNQTPGVYNGTFEIQVNYN